MVAREPLTLRLLAQHCYSLDAEEGSLWALFGPHHREGASRAAGWLAERAENLAAVDAQRRLVVSSAMHSAARRLAPLLEAAPVTAVIARADGIEDARALMGHARDAGLRRHDSGQQALIVEGESPLDDDEIFLAAGMRVAGRLPVIEDDRILRLQGGRRDRPFLKALDGVAARLLALSELAGAPEDGTGGDAAAAAGGSLTDRPGQPVTAVNGSHDGASAAEPAAGAGRREERV